MPQAHSSVRIAHVIHGLPRGGLENGVINLVNGLSGVGLEHTVFCLDRRGEMADRLIPEVPLYVFDRKRHDLTLPFRLAKRIRELQPHVIHCRNWNTWMDTVVARSIARSNAPLLWSFHGFERGGSYPFRRRFASQLLASRTSRLIAVCQDSAVRYASETGIAADRFDVLYNGVDCHKFKPSLEKSELRNRFGYDDGQVVILTVASLSEIKDHSSLLRVAAKVVTESDKDPLFVFIGEGGERSKLTGEIEKLGLTDVVIMAGASDEVPDHLAAADIFVLPSKLEGMSNAILEAMACGLPVIANAVGGNPELVNTGETGILTPPGDTDSMAQAIEDLLADKSVRLRMGNEGRRRAERIFSIDAMLERYKEYYLNVAASAELGQAGPNLGLHRES